MDQHGYDFIPMTPNLDSPGSMHVRTVSYASPTAAAEFTASLRETGFAVLRDHPIPAAQIERSFSEWRGFFDSAGKEAHVFQAGVQAGFFPFRTENAKDSRQKDLKEFYHHYPLRKDLPPGTREATPPLYARLCELGQELLGWIEANTPETVRAQFQTPLTQMIEGSEETLLRILHYPALSGSEEEGAVRAAAHEDINLITLLPAATAPGLEVQDRLGLWHSVACDPGMIVVNAGDMLQETSRGYYPSTTHRVINPSGPSAKVPRYSMPLFLHARRDAPIAPGLTAGAYLDERLRAIGLK